MILTQPILFIHKPNKSKFPSDIIKHSLGIIVMQGMYAYAHIYSCFSLGFFHNTRLCIHDTRSTICKNKVKKYTLFTVHDTWFTNTLRENFSSGISEPFL